MDIPNILHHIYGGTGPLLFSKSGETVFSDGGGGGFLTDESINFVSNIFDSGIPFIPKI